MSESESGSMTAGILDLAKVVALVVGGCWTLYEYVGFQHEQQQLAIQQATLNVKQQKLLHEQTITANQHAKLLLHIEAADRELHRKDLGLTVALRNEDVKLATLKEREAQRGLDYGGAKRLSRSAGIYLSKLGETGDGRAIYEATYTFSLTNHSQVSHELSAFILDAYVGNARSLDASHDAAEPLGSPANRFTATSATPGCADWRLSNSWGAVAADALGRLGRRWPAAPDVKLSERGGLVGVIGADQERQLSETFRVIARPDGYLALYMNYCLHRCKSSEDLHTRWEYLPLREAHDASGTPGRASPEKIASARNQ